MDSKLNRSERQEKKRLGTGDEERKRERPGKRGKVRVKKDGKIFYSRTNQPMGSVHFFNIYNYNNNNGNNNNINNNDNCSNNNNN